MNALPIMRLIIFNQNIHFFTSFQTKTNKKKFFFFFLSDSEWKKRRMELETDAIEENFATVAPKGKRKVRFVHRSSKARKTVLSFVEPTKTDTTEGSLLSNNNSPKVVKDKMLFRGGRLVEEWTAGRCSAEMAVPLIEDTVSLGLKCLDYYGYIDEDTQMPDAETLRLRLLCLSDRFVAGLGGTLAPTDSLSDLLFVALIVLLKTWSDYGIHLILFEWKSLNVATVAEQELRYLTAVRFKTHISHRNIFDFATRLRLLST